MKTYLFQHETATYAPGETETLDPVTVHATTRENANLTMAGYVHEFGGRVVRCDSCSDVPLLVGEVECAECVAFAKADRVLGVQS